MHSKTSMLIVFISCMMNTRPLSPDKTTWKGDNLKSLSTSKCDKSSLINISVSEVAEVSAVDEDTVNHPLFGKID